MDYNITSFVKKNMMQPYGIENFQNQFSRNFEKFAKSLFHPSFSKRFGLNFQYYKQLVLSGILKNSIYKNYYQNLNIIFFSFIFYNFFVKIYKFCFLQLFKNL